MNTATTIPTAPPAQWSLAAYRKYNDALEAKYGPSLTQTQKLHAQARAHLARARRAGGRLELAVEELEGAVASMLDVIAREEPAR